MEVYAPPWNAIVVELVGFKDHAICTCGCDCQELCSVPGATMITVKSGRAKV